MRVLFLDRDNASRSQMAEGFVRVFADDGFEAYSAGVAPAELIDDRALSLMSEVGAELGGQRTKPLADLADIRFDVVITLGERRLPAPPARLAYAHWRIPDPSVLDTARYRDIRHDIGHRVRRLLNALAGLATSHDQDGAPFDLGAE
jgi:protein-tyrosine-phosphatase